MTQDLIIGAFAGFFITEIVLSWLWGNNYQEGYKAGMDWARQYWEPKVKKLEQQRIREWLR